MSRMLSKQNVNPSDVLVDSREFRNVLGSFCTGVVIVTGLEDGEPVGFTAQSLVALSLSPPLIGVSPAKTSSSWQRIKTLRKFGVNILASRQQHLSKKFATSGIDRFSDTGWELSADGVPMLGGVLAYVGCNLENEFETGDHTLAVGRVTDLRFFHAEERPLLFYRGRHSSLEDGGISSLSEAS